MAFKGVGLELGGKDPAYVRPDANIDYTVGELVDGSFFNSGQSCVVYFHNSSGKPRSADVRFHSCCGIERIYVHEKIFDQVRGPKTLRFGRRIG